MTHRSSGHASSPAAVPAQSTAVYVSAGFSPSSLPDRRSLANTFLFGLLFRLLVTCSSVLFACVCLLSCSGPGHREPVTPVIIEDEPEEAKEYSISRGRYEEVLKDGMQKVMRWYFVKPYYKGSKFVGFEVSQILNEDLLDGPLRIGDVILRINDGVIERPEQALAVWRGLWTKKRLKLQLLRKNRTVVYDIPIVAEDGAAR